MKELKVTVATFRDPIRSYGASITGEPERALYDDPTTRKSRQATMYYTELGLRCEQDYGTIIVPLANVAFVRLED